MFERVSEIRAFNRRTLCHEYVISKGISGNMNVYETHS